MQNANERLATAHHEAGHAVVSVILDVNLVSVELTPDSEEHHGLCTNDSLRPDLGDMDKGETRLYIEGRIMIFFAGQLAQAKFLGQTPDTFDGHDSDDDRALDMALYVCDSEQESHAFQVWLFERTRNLVRMSWKQIETVAGALAAAGSLTGDEVIALMKNTMSG